MDEINFLFESGMVIAICDIVCEPNNISTQYISQRYGVVQFLISVYFVAYFS